MSNRLTRSHPTPVHTELGDSILSQDKAGGAAGEQGKKQQHAHRRHHPFWPLHTEDFWGLLFTALGLMIAAGGGIGGGGEFPSPPHPVGPSRERRLCVEMCSASRYIMLTYAGILVPIFILVMGFSPKYAIPLSNVTILGGSIMNMVMNIRKRSVNQSPALDKQSPVNINRSITTLHYAIHHQKCRHPSADRPLVDWDLILIMEPLTIGGALAGSFLNKVRPYPAYVGKVGAGGPARRPMHRLS